METPAVTIRVILVENPKRRLHQVVARSRNRRTEAMARRTVEVDRDLVAQDEMEGMERVEGIAVRIVVTLAIILIAIIPRDRSQELRRKRIVRKTVTKSKMVATGAGVEVEVCWSKRENFLF